MNFPGIPPLLNQAANISNTVALLRADAALLLGMFNPAPQWGVYSQGSPVFTADNVVSLEYKQDYRIADYPMEQGAFQSYNKVFTPYEAKVRMTKGGTLAERHAFLDQLEAIGDSMEMFDVVTPERTYLHTNVQHYDYRRTATNGVGLITVDLWLVEVRVDINPTKFTQTAQPSGVSPTQLGTVQTMDPTSAQSTAFYGGAI